MKAWKVSLKLKSLEFTEFESERDILSSLDPASGQQPALFLFLLRLHPAPKEPGAHACGHPGCKSRIGPHLLKTAAN